MKLAVCIKHVPDTTVQPRIKSDGSGIDYSSINKFVISPYDEFGLTEAISLKSRFGGEVDIFTVGPDKAQESLRKGIAMGADHATHIKTPDNTVLPGLTTAKLLAAELKKEEYDIIFFGMKAVDDELAMVGPAVAAVLDIPVVDNIHELNVNDDGTSGICKRETASGTEELEARFPVVFTTNKGMNNPKPPSLPAIMKAKKVQLNVVEPDIGDIGVEVAKVEFPPERGDVQMLDEEKGVDELMGVLKDDVKVL